MRITGFVFLIVLVVTAAMTVFIARSGRQSLFEPMGPDPALDGTYEDGD